MVIRWLVGAEQLPHRWLNGQRFRRLRRCLPNLIGTKAEFRSCFLAFILGFAPAITSYNWVSSQSHPSTPPFSRQPRAAKVGRDPPDPGHWDRGRRHDQVDLPQHRALEMVRRWPCWRCWSQKLYPTGDAQIYGFYILDILVNIVGI